MQKIMAGHAFYAFFWVFCDMWLRRLESRWARCQDLISIVPNSMAKTEQLKYAILLHAKVLLSSQDSATILGC